MGKLFSMPGFQHAFLAIIHVIENLLLLAATTAFNILAKNGRELLSSTS